MKLLVIGYGNPGRLDDGLGPAFAERIAGLGLAGVTVESNYQLNIEDAELVSKFDVVVFADASVDAVEPFEFKPLESTGPVVGFSSHSVTAAALLGLAEQLFHAKPASHALAIRGNDFNDFGERLSDRARANLDAAVGFFKSWVEAR